MRSPNFQGERQTPRYGWDRQVISLQGGTRQWNGPRSREAGQTIPGRDRPTNKITRSEAAPSASAINVSLERVIAILMSLAICLRPQSFVRFVASLFPYS